MRTLKSILRKLLFNEVIMARWISDITFVGHIKFKCPTICDEITIHRFSKAMESILSTSDVVYTEDLSKKVTVVRIYRFIEKKRIRLYYIYDDKTILPPHNHPPLIFPVQIIYTRYLLVIKRR